MNGLYVALLGGIVWIGLRGDAAPATFLVGGALSAGVAWMARLSSRGGISPTRLPWAGLLFARLLVLFAVELAIANARQLKLVLSPRLCVQPRWVRFTTRLEHPWSRLILGVLISLTPGTVTQELRGDEYVIHVLDAAPGADPLVAIRSRLEAPLLRLEAL